MINKLITLLLAVLASVTLQGQEKVTLSGKVTDFEGNPIDSAIIRVMDRDFKVPYLTYSRSDGTYSIMVEKGVYNCVYATKISEYRKTKLEYWAWNVPLMENLEINPQYNNMEIYGINAFEPQITPYETYMIYFRPMSLKKIIQIIEKQAVDKQSFENIGKVEQLLTPDSDNLFNMSPDSISTKELTVKVNGFDSKIVTITRVKEYARGMFMYGYFIQIVKPEETSKMQLEYDKISITLNSVETNETGLGEVFVKRNF